MSPTTIGSHGPGYEINVYFLPRERPKVMSK